MSNPPPIEGPLSTIEVLERPDLETAIGIVRMHGHLHIALKFGTEIYPMHLADARSMRDALDEAIADLVRLE